MIAQLLESLRSRAEVLIRRHPFLRLVQHFCNRATGISSTSDLDFGLGGLLALLAIPGAFASLLLMDKYSTLLQFLRGRFFNSYLSCLPDEYFFIVYAMTVTGLITLLRWDQLLPDARDFANLASLSLSLRKIFVANVMALATIAALFAIDINLVSVVVFPLLVTLQAGTFRAFCEFVFAHALATIGISAFTFLALVALQGLLMAALPDRLYRRVSLLLRTVLLTLLSGTLISVFLIPLPILQVNYASVRAGAWWPPLWFLSLFESHVGPLRSRSALGAGTAWRALACAAALTVCGFSLSYKRYFLKIPERQAALSTASASGWLPFRSTLAVFRPLLCPGFETACFKFVFRTLVRNETHLLFAGLWAGIGLLLTLQELHHAAQSLLVAPLTFTLFSLSGIRFVFDLPSTAHANWLFRLIADGGVSMVRPACLKLMLFAGLLPLLLIWFPVAFHLAGWRLAMVYLLFHILTISLLVELLLWKFQKVPFTCSLVPSRDRFLKMAVGLLLVLLLALPALARVEAYVVEHPLTLPFFIGLLVAALVWLHRNGASESETLLYQDNGTEAFVLLRLGND